MTGCRPPEPSRNLGMAAAPCRAQNVSWIATPGGCGRGGVQSARNGRNASGRRLGPQVAVPGRGRTERQERQARKRPEARTSGGGGREGRAERQERQEHQRPEAPEGQREKSTTIQPGQPQNQQPAPIQNQIEKN